MVLLERQTVGSKLDRIIEVLCGRLSMAVSDTGNADTNVVVPVSASFGVASFPEDGQDAETLLHIADLKMYETKKRIKGSARMGPYKPSFR